ncbi:MAG: 4Fe-4S binding protein [Clostridiaceae bacterium]
MNIAVLSGKGGTGKTTISTNLAVMMKANYYDCDVEEPNGYIFLNPINIKEKKVLINYPVIDKDKCINCGKCADACMFNALAKTKNDIILFEKLCHGCKACSYACPNDAISFSKREIGIIEQGYREEIEVNRGLLNIGEPLAPPIIKQLLKDTNSGLNILDSAPGTSCSVVNTLFNADYAILVSEPSKFGVHDLKMAASLLKSMNIPFGAIVNKYTEDEQILTPYLKEENIKILGNVPYSKKAAILYSNGKLLIEDKEYNDIFKTIASSVMEVVKWN